MVDGRFIEVRARSPLRTPVLAKSTTQMEWARCREYSKGRVLSCWRQFAVATQTVAEAARFGIDAVYAAMSARTPSPATNKL